MLQSLTTGPAPAPRRALYIAQPRRGVTALTRFERGTPIPAPTRRVAARRHRGGWAWQAQLEQEKELFKAMFQDKCAAARSHLPVPT